MLPAMMSSTVISCQIVMPTGQGVLKSKAYQGFWAPQNNDDISLIYPSSTVATVARVVVVTHVESLIKQMIIANSLKIYYASDTVLKLSMHFLLVGQLHRRWQK